MANTRLKRARLGTIEIQAGYVEDVRALLENPMKPGSLKYGALNDYIEQLVKQDLEARKCKTDGLVEGLLNGK